MECPSPAVNMEYNNTWFLKRVSRSLPGKVNDHPYRLSLKIGFIMDNVLTVRDLDKHFKHIRSTLIYVEDPTFFKFPTDKSYKGDTLVIEVIIFVNYYYFFYSFLFYVGLSFFIIIF